MVDYLNVLKSGQGGLVNLGKVVLLCSNLICCFNIPFFLSTLLLVGYKGDGTNIKCHILLPSLAYHDLEGGTLNHYLTGVSVHGT